MWFSSMLRLICLVEGEGAVAEEKSVVVFKAAGPHEAKAQIINLCRDREERYLNVDGKRVRWTVREIQTIDWLEEGADLGESREVYSAIDQLPEADPSIPVDIEYRLEDAEPRQSGV